MTGLCHETREHYHAPGGLVGFALDYLADREVWRTSLAAEYPCGLFWHGLLHQEVGCSLELGMGGLKADLIAS